MLSKLQKVSEEFNVAVLMTNQVRVLKILFEFQFQNFNLITTICSGHVDPRWSHVLRARSKEGIPAMEGSNRFCDSRFHSL
jgi:hypothetical protein